MPKGWKPSNDKSSRINTGLLCKKCSNINPEGAIFCNKCGSPFTPTCGKCGYSNPVGALFCGRCGTRIELKNDSSDAGVEDSIMETNYLECVVPEWNFKINYPASWLRVDRAFVGPPVVVGFMSPKESPSDPFMESFNVATEDVPDVTLQSLVDSSVANKKQSDPSFVLIESVPTTLGGIPAHQIVFTESELKSLCVMALKQRKSYYLLYQAKPDKYIKFLAIAEQMISSFQFLE